MLVALSATELRLKEDVLDFLRGLTVVLGGTLAILSCLYMFLMNKEFRKTFFSVETGRQMTVRLFDEGTEQTRGEIFKYNWRQWVSIEGKVKKWVKKNWETWEGERPEWFTDVWISNVPASMLPSMKERQKTLMSTRTRITSVERSRGRSRGRDVVVVDNDEDSDVESGAEEEVVVRFSRKGSGV